MNEYYVYYKLVDGGARFGKEAVQAKGYDRPIYPEVGRVGRPVEFFTTTAGKVDTFILQTPEGQHFMAGIYGLERIEEDEYKRTRRLNLEGMSVWVTEEKFKVGCTSFNLKDNKVRDELREIATRLIMQLS